VRRSCCADLEAKAAAMNAAAPSEKVDAIAAVVNELVAQRRAMTAGCPMMGDSGEKMHGMMGAMEHGSGEHGGMRQDAPAAPSGGVTP
jgi:hypothetical protein